MWNMILGHLDSSKDLMNASHASPLFNSLLENNKSEWMFEQVNSQHIFYKQSQLNLECSLTSYAYFCLIVIQVLPHVFKDLRKADILNLRLVCKQWCTGVDNFIEGHPSLLPFDEKIYRTVQSNFNYLPLAAKIYDDIAFVNAEEFENFMATMAGHPRNPFFGRSVRIGSCGDLWDYMDDAIENTWEGAAQLCHQFGVHLWHVEFANYEFSLSALDFYQGISRSLANLPNIKSLHMNGALDAKEEDDNQLLEYMENHPLPQLPHLESLVFDLVMENDPVEEGDPLVVLRNRGLPDDPDVLLEYLQNNPEIINQLFMQVPPTPDNFQDKFITTYAGQLKKLEIDLPSWREEYNTLLTRLTEVHLKHVNSIPNLKSLLHGLQAPHLRKLTLSLRCSMKINQLFEVLQPLQILCLDFGYLGEAPDDYLEGSIDDVLPNISTLKFLRIKDTSSMKYEYMKSFTSLEHIDIWECQSAKNTFLQPLTQSIEPDPETIAHQPYEPELQVPDPPTPITDELRKLIYIEGEGNASDEPEEKSKIWELLPSLKLITYRTRSGLPSIIRRFARDNHSWEYIGVY